MHALRLVGYTIQPMVLYGLILLILFVIGLICYYVQFKTSTDKKSNVGSVENVADRKSKDSFDILVPQGKDIWFYLYLVILFVTIGIPLVLLLIDDFTNLIGLLLEFMPYYHYESHILWNYFQTSVQQSIIGYIIQLLHYYSQ